MMKTCFECSNQSLLEFDKVDNSHYFDEDGKSYYQYDIETYYVCTTCKKILKTDFTATAEAAFIGCTEDDDTEWSVLYDDKNNYLTLPRAIEMLRDRLDAHYTDEYDNLYEQYEVLVGDYDKAQERIKELESKSSEVLV